MDSENAAEETTPSSLSSLISLAFASSSSSSSAQQPYFSELLSFNLDRLQKEPELLRVDAERIRRQMQEVAVGSYRAFIAASGALSTIGEQVSAIDNYLESLVFILLFYFLVLDALLLY
nr:uncharacterized protein LOC111988962 [Quercus suber]